MNVITFTVTTGSGAEFTHELPARFEVCDRCEGYGTHLNPSIGQHAYSAEEFAESFDDEEREQYFTRGGRYDVSCEVCGGKRVVAVPDEDECQRTLRGRRLLALYKHQQEQRARWDAEDRAIWRMESGGWV